MEQSELTAIDEYFELAVKVIETGSVLLLVIGILISTVSFFKAYSVGDSDPFLVYRRGLGRTLLLALEFLIAADILETVTIDRTLESVGILGLLVVVRTFLSWSIELELTGRWPWQLKDGG